VIDIKVFQAALLIVCVLAFVLSTLSVSGVFLTFTTSNRWARALIKLAFVALSILSGLCAALLVLLA
jgi:hypothetical protein